MFKPAELSTFARITKSPRSTIYYTYVKFRGQRTTVRMLIVQTIGALIGSFTLVVFLCFFVELINPSDPFQRRMHYGPPHRQVCERH
jgi:hypothetical protein